MAGIGGFATTLAGSVSTTPIGEITSISFPELGMTDIDVSSFNSASNFMEFVGGSVDPGVIDMEINYVPANETLLLESFNLTANQTWTLTLPDESTWATSGYMNKMGGGSSAPNDKISRTVSIKCSGVPTHSA